MNIFEDEGNSKRAGASTLEDDQPSQLPGLALPGFSIDQMPTQVNLRATRSWSSLDEQETLDGWAIDEMLTWILPAVNPKHVKNEATKAQKVIVADTVNHVVLLRNLIKSSGIYALASVAPPLVTLGLAPFLTRHLSPTDYGALTILNGAIGLGAGITQLGLGSAFFRAYSYDYTSRHDRRDVIATVSTLLCLVSIITVIGAAITAPFLANLLLG